MAILESNSVRGALLPAAASIAGAGIGLVLTRKQNGSIGDLADDLLGRLGSVKDSVKDKAPTPTPSRGNASMSVKDRGELETRRRARAQRRNQRRSKR